jgi:hypothetical protein
MSDDNDDEPYVPKVTTKPKPDYLDRKDKANLKRQGNRPSQSNRIVKYRRELREMNIHKPLRHTTKQHVEAIKSIKEHLTETWKSHWDKVENYRKLTPKQIEFARQYAINGRTNKCGAARLAGYDSGNYNVLLRMANKNLAIPHFHDLVTAFEIEEKARMKINIEDVVKWFNDIATAAMQTGDFTNANRAMENLAKYLGMFVDKKEITHRTVHSKEELDTRISELTAILKEAEPELERKLRIN